MGNFTPIFLNGKTIGQVNPDGTFQKHVKLRHFLQKPPAIAYDCEALKQAKNAGAKSLVVICEDGTRFSCDLTTFERFSFSLNRGYGEQRALALAFWQRQRPGEVIARQLAFGV